MSEVLNTGTSTEVQADLQAGAAVREAVASAGANASAETKASAVSKVEAVAHSKWYLWRKEGTALVKYLLDSEVHTFAFSVAANAILSFIPFIFMLYTLSRTIFHSKAMIITVNNVVNDIAKDFLPAALKDQNFWTETVAAHTPHHVQFFSLLMILVACTGIFLPLEVALNQAWGVVKSRNYLANQVVALGLATLMVLLGMSCVLVNAGFRWTEDFILPHGLKLLGIDFSGGVSYLVLAFTTGLASIAFFFAVYWLLPNRKVAPAPIMRTAVVTGTIWLGARYIFALILPHMDLGAIYGPFYVSVGVIFWAYVSGLIMFAGAQFSVARRGVESKKSSLKVIAS